MRIWFFDQHSGVLIPSMEADKGYNEVQDPRHPGKSIESIYSTKKEPKKYGKNETVVFDGDKWEVKPDYRFIEAWYKKDGSKVSITEIDIEPDGEFVEIAPEGLSQPVWDETVNKWRKKTEKERFAEMYEEDRDDAVSVMRHECEITLTDVHYRKELPFKGYHVRADQKSKDILIGMTTGLIYGTRHFPLPWIVCENILITIDNDDEMRELFTMIDQQVQASILANSAAKEAIDNADTFEEAWGYLEAYKNA